MFNGVNGQIAEGEVNAVCRSGNQSMLVAGTSNTVHATVKLFRYPALPGAVPALYGGHTSPVLDVCFLHDDSAVATAGGNDSCIFQFAVSKGATTAGGSST